MLYGVMQCMDAFLYVHTFLPVRCLLAVFAIFWRSIAKCLGRRRSDQPILAATELYDLLKGIIWIVAIGCMQTVDINRIYHIVKSQSVIKLYIFYNMLDIGNRLLSAFGQDTIDALLIVADTTKRQRYVRLCWSVSGYMAFALAYVLLHSVVILLQATVLNVAINSNTNGLLGIMRSNNFVELKGSVFKIQDKNNLFQLSCNDVRERVHLTVLLFVVIVQTLKEFNWSQEQLYAMLPDYFGILLVEMITDWIKHIFIIRFNTLSVDTYKDYRVSLAYDLCEARKNNAAISDHSDLVARRIGFVSFPLSVVVIKVIFTAVHIDDLAAVFMVGIGVLTLFLVRVLNTIVALGMACRFVEQYERKRTD